MFNQELGKPIAILDEGITVTNRAASLDLTGAGITATGVGDDVTADVPGGGGSGDVATDVIWDTKGDLAGGTGADTAVKLVVGANGEVLTADSTQVTGMKWSAIAGTGDVTAAANLGDNLLIRGDGAGKGVQNSGITISDTDSLTGILSLTATGTITGNIYSIGAPTTLSITAITDTINAHTDSHYDISSDADYVMTSAPTIPDGADGQILYLHNSGSFTVDIQDEADLIGSNILLGAAEGTIRIGGVMMLMFDSSAGGWLVLSNPNTASAGTNATTLSVRNGSGASIAAGKAVYISGYNVGQARPLIALADANVDAQMPAIGITSATIANGSNGDVVTAGTAFGLINTSTASVGDGVWIDATTPGEVVFTRPTADQIQRIGTVARSHATSGSVIITGAGRTNDTPISITVSEVLATANDSGALGASGTAFSDLFLASGGVINFATGDVTLTHSTGLLALAGGDISIAPLSKLYLDGGVDTYIVEGTGNRMDFVIGGTDTLFMSAGVQNFRVATSITTQAGNLTLNPVGNVVITDTLQQQGDIFIEGSNGIVVGHTGQLTINALIPETQILGTADGVDASVAIGGFGTGVEPSLILTKARGTIASPLAAQNGDNMGEILWVGHDGTDFTNTNLAKIHAIADGGAVADTNSPGALIFSTTPTGAGTVTEAMRIDASQDLLLPSTNKLVLNGTTKTAYLYEKTSTIVSMFSSSGEQSTWGPSYFAVNNNLIMASAKKLYFDGGGDTYIIESSGNVLDFYTNNVVALKLDALNDATFANDILLSSGAIINFNAGDITLTHSANTLTVAGGTLATEALTATTITGSGILSIDDVTDSTSGTTGSIHTDGGLGVAKAAFIGTDLTIGSASAGDSVIDFYASAVRTWTMGLDDSDSDTWKLSTSADFSTGNIISVTTAGNVTLGNSLYLTEQADADADVAGFGQLWVDTITPNVLKFTDDAGTDFNISDGVIKYIDWRILDSASSQTVTTTVGGDFEFPFTGTIVSIGAYVDTAGTTGTATYDVNIAGTTIMTTDKISIETAEKSSRDAVTQPTLTTTAVTAGDIITADTDAIQTGTAALGLVIRFGVRLT